MDALWSSRERVSCIHPGWGPLIGRAAVMESWHAILTGPSPPQIEAHQAQAFVAGASAYVICYERVGAAHLIATNVFV
jgi:hypothetical protein